MDYLKEYNRWVEFVTDKDDVNDATMICEMFVYYKTQGISLLTKLDEIWNKLAIVC